MGYCIAVLPQRILIYGVTGSGKTTLARRVAGTLGYRWISADDEIGWLPHWTPREVADQREIAARVAGGNQWVLDTAYGQWLDLVLPRADVILALDYPRWRSLWRLVLRSVRRAADKQPICNGNTETFRQMLSSDSIIVWHFRSFARKRARIRRWVAHSPGATVVHLRSPGQAEQYLRALAGYRAQ